MSKLDVWIDFLLSNIPTYFKPNKQRKIKNLTVSDFFRSIVSKLKFMEELYSQNSLDSVPNDFKNLWVESSGIVTDEVFLPAK
jgi:hypothetical protein